MSTCRGGGFRGSARGVCAAVILVLTVWRCAAVQGGQIILNNGDRLTGKLEKVVDGKAYFVSDLVGPVTVGLDKVLTFTTDEPVKIVLQDDTVISRQITAAQNGVLTLAESNAANVEQIKMADVVAVNPPAPETPKWGGSVSVGWTSVHGNTRSESLNASAEASLRREKDRTSLRFDYGRSEQENKSTGEEETTEDWWRARGKYDFFLTEKFYGFLEGRYETDKIAELDRRVIGGVGAGYQWIESDRMNFATEAGIAYLTERFDNETPGNHETSAQAGYHFDIKINERLKFINDLTYYPSFGQFSDYFLTTTAELRAMLNKNMYANFRVLFDYDTSPAAGQGNTDVKYILGVGADF
ncbi:MAG TPA: DUF481 domain-containing protein [Anaerohalosphaeraceae bacterium]|jgi:putative salt-induced outer membrane protein YdiY|nr:DUF481 domain-containing protein [Anaerohalosphaeraceae bacterium]HRT51104.1 DUF481 domain-containing protein [Anaerohalosphaeraceae bacterium]HRT87119.1 DUF481 domain-containing protein [Anaerohalosphaeraceae bacterium]